MTSSFGIRVFSLCLLGGIFAQEIPAEVPSRLRADDSGLERVFEIACDELHCFPSDGAKSHPIRFGNLGNPQRLVKRAIDLAGRTGNHFEIVLYEVGVEKTEGNRRVATGRLRVRLTQGIDLTTIEAIVEASGAVDSQRLSFARDFLILKFDGPGSAIDAMGKVSELVGVESVSPLLANQHQKRGIPNDPLFGYQANKEGYQWHLRNTGQNGGVSGIDANVIDVWDNYTGNGVVIGIVDDGLLEGHPDLAANVIESLGFNWNHGLEDNPNPRIGDHHGTAVSGIAAAVGNNNIGVSGAAPDANLVGLRLIAGSIDDQDEAESVSHEAGNIDIKNNSWGPDDDGRTLEGPGPLMTAAFADTATNGRAGKGTIHVWAAGNGREEGDYSGKDGYASSIYTIAIGAIDDDGTQASYSESGANIVVSSPSDGDFGDQNITTTDLTSGRGYNDGNFSDDFDDEAYTNSFGGTSAATPLAAGVVALMLEANPNLGWRDVQEILMRSARKIDVGNASWQINGAGFNMSDDYGSGLIDAEAAVALSQSWVNLGPQNTDAIDRSTIDLPIPDNYSVGLEEVFDFSSTTTPLRVEHVEVTVDISHIRRGDLEVFLTSPEGTVSRLVANSNRDGGDHYENWTFMSVRHWGESSDGLWTVKVADRRGNATGTLHSIRVKFYGTDSAPPIDPPAISSLLTATATAGAEFSYRITATNSPTSFGASPLPAGLMFDSMTGLISGIPTSDGNPSITISATNGIGTGDETLSLTILPVPPEPPEITSVLNEDIEVGSFFSYQITATHLPTSFAASPLPEGLSIDPSGLISGTPTSAEEADVTISATNNFGTDSETLMLSIMPPLDEQLRTAVDSTLTFSTGGDSSWGGQTQIFKIDGDAAQSGSVDDGESSFIETLVEGPGLLSFYWSVSSEKNYDVFDFLIDDHVVRTLSGKVGFKKVTLPIETGPHRITWRYSKDDSASELNDAAYLDQVIYVGGGSGVPADQIGQPMRGNTPSPGTTVSPFTGIFEGKYHGLIEEDSDENGFIGELFLKLKATGSFTAKVTHDGYPYTVRGEFDGAGSFIGTVPGKNSPNLDLSLQTVLTTSGRKIGGNVNNGLVNGVIDLQQAAFDRKDNPAPNEGVYTLLIPSNADGSAVEPQGNGYALIKVGADGKTSAKVALGDSTRFSDRAVTSVDLEWPLYQDLYRSKPQRGLVAGILTFSDEPSVSDIDGMLRWLKRGNTGDKLYPAPFDLRLQAVGSDFVAPAKNEACLDSLNLSMSSNAEFSFFGGGVSLIQNPITVTWSGKDRVQEDGFKILKGNVNRRSGLIKVSYSDRTQNVKFRMEGVIFQKQSLASGFFIGDRESGFFVGEARPE